MLNCSPWTLASVLLPFLLTAVPAGASGQDTTFIADAPACSSCSLELEHLASISSSDEVHVYSTGLFVETPSHYVLSHIYEEETLHLFDKDGDFVRSVGRAGDGPGDGRAGRRQLSRARQGHVRCGRRPDRAHGRVAAPVVGGSRRHGSEPR